MRSIFFRPTGRFPQTVAEARNLPAEQMLIRGEIHEVEFLQDTRGLSIYAGGNLNSGEIDSRLNAAATIADQATGYQIATNTLTYISRMITRQRFYEFAPGDYVPIHVGEGAFAADFLFNQVLSVAEDFEAGNIRQGSANQRMSAADMAIASVPQKTQFWAKDVSYSIIEVEQAIRANSWDPIMLKMEARKKNWDLGLQATAILGLASDPTNFPGLLTNPNVNTNLSVITKAINTMSATEFATFVAALIPAYLTNTGSATYPDTFLMPQDDYIACAGVMVQNVIAAGSGTYVGMSIIDYLEMAFRKQCRNPNFRIVPMYYAQAAVNNTLRGLNKAFYALYRMNPEDIEMNIPVDLTVLQAGTINNFQFQQAAYGQYTGVVAKAPLRLLLFKY